MHTFYNICVIGYSGTGKSTLFKIMKFKHDSDKLFKDIFIKKNKIIKVKKISKFRDMESTIIKLIKYNMCTGGGFIIRKHNIKYMSKYKIVIFMHNKETKYKLNKYQYIIKKISNFSDRNKKYLLYSNNEINNEQYNKI